MDLRHKAPPHQRNPQLLVLVVVLISPQMVDCLEDNKKLQGDSWFL